MRFSLVVPPKCLNTLFMVLSNNANVRSPNLRNRRHSKTFLLQCRPVCGRCELRRFSNRQDFGILHSRSRLQLLFPLLLASVFAEAEKPPTTVVDKLRHQVETDEFKSTTIKTCYFWFCRRNFS